MKIIKLNSELHIDEVSNAAYLYINKENKNKVSFSSSLLDDNNSMINIDFSDNNEVI
jgi:hypothetical protein